MDIVVLRGDRELGWVGIFRATGIYPEFPDMKKPTWWGQQTPTGPAIRCSFVTVNCLS